ncbi:PIR Superfamily Protein [Plasmodium ovale wallikeri]|uniref:PIR Superfamily Protein n=1 Tax=Plasmodium ovale wallikeri TaxID=864142 RepID=A0A1A9AE61_PLAOA|nr:PIR Superfamily Protein [Plasmodium ovale wallikeri]
MANDSGYSIHTHYIPIDAFTSTITNDIKNLIRKYGHIDCGLRHEELCEELNKYIYEKKTLELSFMNTDGKKKWNSEWSSKRIGFFNRLFEEEGFTNMCYPYKKIGNQSLYQLKSKHIKFCKKRDEWKAHVERNNEYNECVKYNQWVIAEIKSLTNEFLGNVKVSYLPTVKKYFRTKTQPEGYEPPDKYRNSRLDCTQYNPPQRSNPKGPAEKNFREYHNSFVRNIRACQGDQYLLPPVEILDTGIIVAPFVLILVISLILPLLYKFTPFGPWIHQRIGKNKNMLNNIIEEE